MQGWKTWVGTVGWALCEGAKQMWPEYAGGLATAQNLIFLPLGVFGIGHKLDKIREVR